MISTYLTQSHINQSMIYRALEMPLTITYNIDLGLVNNLNILSHGDSKSRCWLEKLI